MKQKIDDQFTRKTRNNKKNNNKTKGLFINGGYKILNILTMQFFIFKILCLKFHFSASFLPFFILLHEKFLQFDWLRAVVFQLNLKYLDVKITNLAGSSINN